jgi:4-hydroxymandelate synthase
MATRDIAYVEIHVGDEQVIDYYVKSLGFTKEAEAAESGGTSTLLRQGTAQLIVTTGPAAGAFWKTHGDGVVDIALTCDDVTATARMAAAAGARVTADGLCGPVVSGPGDIRHTLLSADTDGRRFPPGRQWTAMTDPAAAVGGAPAAGLVKLLDHVAICVAGGTLTDTADFYAAALGLPRYSSEYVTTGDQAMDSIVVRNDSGSITFTIVAPDNTKNPGQLDSFLARNEGPGVQHLAFAVDDLVGAVRKFRHQGVEFLSVPPGYYDGLASRLPSLRAEVAELRETAVLADRDEWGYLLQVFSRSPHERNTLFYEFIQRRGARGFGSANIRALYEAVERDRLIARAASVDS